jgi:translocation protein SEC63
MGIALPPWIVESRNNVWVLGVYGILFGGALPLLVGRWWFGNRQKTKDGINAKSAAAFFKSISEDGSTEEVVSALGKAFEWELPATKGAHSDAAELDDLDKSVSLKAGSQYVEVKKLARDAQGQLHESRRRALILIYAHLTRTEIKSARLQHGQSHLCLQLRKLIVSSQNNAKFFSKLPSSSTPSSMSLLPGTGSPPPLESCVSTLTSPKPFPRTLLLACD